MVVWNERSSWTDDWPFWAGDLMRRWRSRPNTRPLIGEPEHPLSLLSLQGEKMKIKIIIIINWEPTKFVKKPKKKPSRFWTSHERLSGTNLSRQKRDEQKAAQNEHSGIWKERRKEKLENCSAFPLWKRNLFFFNIRNGKSWKYQVDLDSRIFKWSEREFKEVWELGR